MPAEFWALGHSNRTFETFLKMLTGFGIRRLVDVRRFPGSRTVPWTLAEHLQKALAEHGIDYFHRPALGGRRKPLPDSPNSGWRRPDLRGYADHMLTPEFQEALEELIRLGEERPSAIMCSEAVPWRCHRSMIADALVARGHVVHQATAPGKSSPHKLTPFAKIASDRRILYPGDQIDLPLQR